MDEMVAIMTMPPDAAGSPDLWMTVSDVFHIRGQGTVVIGQLQGNVPLNVGDTLVCEDGRWKVRSIEQFRAVITTAEPGSTIGVLLGKGPPGDALRNRTVTFKPGASAGAEEEILAPVTPEEFGFGFGFVLGPAHAPGVFGVTRDAECGQMRCSGQVMFQQLPPQGFQPVDVGGREVVDDMRHGRDPSLGGPARGRKFGDSVITLTTRTRPTGHRGHCVPFRSYSAPK